MWSLRGGEPLGGRYQRKHERLSEASCEKVRDYAEKRDESGQK